MNFVFMGCYVDSYMGRQVQLVHVHIQHNHRIRVGTLQKYSTNLTTLCKRTFYLAG